MTIRRVLSSALIAALLVGLTPAKTWATSPAQEKAQRTRGLRAAISRAATQAATEPSLQMRGPGKPAAQGVRMQSAGGGGHTGMILSIVGTLVGVAGTVYMVKQLQKTQKTVTAGTQ